MSSVDEKHAENIAVARAWWKKAPKRRLLGDHLSLNAVQQARMNGCELPWPATYDVPGTARGYFCVECGKSREGHESDERAALTGWAWHPFKTQDARSGDAK